VVVISLPDVLEICPQPFNASTCMGIVYHPLPGLSLCNRCGSQQGGVRFIKLTLVQPQPQEVA
jgi:hypothetical protein